MLVRLMNAPLSIQRAVAVALLAASALLASAMAVNIVSGLRAQSAALLEAREQAGRLAQIAALKGTASATTDAPGQDGAGLFLEASSVTIARANLQSLIGAIAESAGAAIASAGSVPEIEEHGLKQVGLRADISGSYEAIQRTILDVETAKPPLIIRKMTVRLAAGDLGERAPELSAQIQVYAAYRVGPEPAAVESNGSGATQ